MTTASAQDPLTRVTGAAILDSSAAPTRLLVAQRAYPEKLRGLWEFPGGKQDPGEGAEEALVRECGEELGVTVRLLDEVPAPNPEGWPLKGTAVMRVFTAVVTDDREPAAGEDHLQLRWVALDNPAAILDLDWIPADLPIVRALLEQLAVVGSTTAGPENSGVGTALSGPLIADAAHTGAPVTGTADTGVPRSRTSHSGR
ncbi:DNA mismatch repair protein MutT [Kocuria sp. WRN011]|uniref:(deoxy)nucleoside triphosphate pyrophosphohydrolase n=1 Tax=Kocuria sp. WRN011 TaxID=2029858 RepID=UPI000BAEB3C1|nr:DNA mismatch repair protein MutT [Kocuria sp. WRN011]